MKKTLIIMSVMISSLIFAGSAFAITCTNSYSDLAVGIEAAPTRTDLPMTIQGSKNVCGLYVSDTSAPEGETYDICTSHYSGDKTFGSSEDRQVILSTSSKNAACTEAAFSGTAWTSL